MVLHPAHKASLQRDKIASRMCTSSGWCAARAASKVLILEQIIHFVQRVIRKLAEEGTVSVRADGPYGSASKPEWTAYDTICMIAGGIGVILAQSLPLGMSACKNLVMEGYPKLSDRACPLLQMKPVPAKYRPKMTLPVSPNDSK